MSDNTPTATTTKKLAKASAKDHALDAQKKIFAEAIAQGKNRREAMALAFPDVMGRSSNAYIRLKAYRLMSDDNVITEVATQQARLATLGNKSIDVLEDIMDVGQEHNALEAAKFTYEQIHGKARQSTEIIGKYVVVTYDLSGGGAGPVPQEVLDQLKDDGDPTETG